MTDYFKHAASVGIAMMSLFVFQAGAWATEMTQSAIGPNYNLMEFENTTGVVDQMKTVHQLCQANSHSALQALIETLNSPYPLARRKAAHNLETRAALLSPEDKQYLVNQLQPTLSHSDPIVQMNMIRTMAGLNTPESRAVLKKFILSANKDTQLRAVEALSSAGNAPLNSLALFKQVSPYDEVRKAASESLE